MEQACPEKTRTQVISHENRLKETAKGSKHLILQLLLVTAPILARSTPYWANNRPIPPRAVVLHGVPVEKSRKKLSISRQQNS